MRLRLPDMTCDGCVRGVSRAIQRLDSNARIEADPPSREISITTTASREAIEAVLREAGFPPAADPS